MERLTDARTIAAKRRVRSAAVTMDRRLIIAAIALLDSGGEGAVTLRTVGHASGIPHHAPYKHFKSWMRDRQSRHEIHFEVPQ